MKTRIMVVLLSLAGFVHADIVPPVRWDVETGRMEPRPYTLAIRRGENVKIEPRFLTYNVPMSLTNAAVEMRYSAAYNSATFYSVFGTLQAETGRVQIAWSDALNPTNSSMVYEIRATVGTNVLARAFGSLYLLGGMVGLSTGLTARTSINWSTVAQSGGVAVLTNQMGSGAVWNGTQWTFGAGSVDLSFTNLYYRASNPSNYCTLAAAAGLTNGLQAAGVYLVPADTNRFVDASITNGLGGGSVETDTLASVTARGSLMGTNYLTLATNSRNAYIMTAGAEDSDTDTDVNRISIFAHPGPYPSPTRGASVVMRGNEYSTTGGGDIDVSAGAAADARAGKIMFWVAGGPTYLRQSGNWDFGGHSLSNGVYLGDGSALSGITASQVGAVPTNSIIRGTGYWLIGESGSTSILYHVTSGGHTNQIGSYYTE